MKKGLETIEANINEYDDESKAFLASLKFVDKEITEINTMRRTDGWKILEKKLREELQQRIETLVKDDPRVNVILALLRVADTNSMSKALEEEIAKLLPE